MIMPGVQKPHWRPCWSQNACWSGWRVAPSAIPSMVLISRPSAWTASIVQDLALCAVDVDGAGAAVARVAADVGAGQPEVVAQEVDEQEARLDVRLVGLAVDGDRDVLGGHRGRCLLRVREGALDGRAERPEGQLGDHRPLVVDGTADVADRAGSAPRRPRRPARKRSSDGALADEERLGVGRRERRVRRRRSRRSRRARSCRPSPSRTTGGDADRGEVADLALELLVGAAGAARPRAGCGSRSGPRSARWRS